MENYAVRRVWKNMTLNLGLQTAVASMWKLRVQTPQRFSKTDQYLPKHINLDTNNQSEQNTQTLKQRNFIPSWYHQFYPMIKTPFLRDLDAF